VKFLYDTVVAHGMSVGQLKQAILSELAEKHLMDSVPLNWSALAVLIVMYGVWQKTLGHFQKIAVFV